MKYHRTNKFIFSYLYEYGELITDIPIGWCACSLQRSMCIFLETTGQHASRQIEETIYCLCKVCKNVVIFKDREVIREHLV
jgi:hypothetical protein